MSDAPGAPLLAVKNLRMHFPVQTGFLQRDRGAVRAVDDISFDIRAGETLGLVGESGCGKTTTGRCLLRVLEPTGGQILYRPRTGAPVDLARLAPQALKPYRQEIRLVFQDPFASLNPRLTVRDIVGESLKVNWGLAGSALEARVAELLSMVGLRPEYMRRYPHAFSGGERQRIGIARALALNPRLVVADEAVSALDVSIRSQVLNLLQDLQDQLHLTYLFVSHDLSVIKYACDRVAVMYVGKLVEVAETRAVFLAPQHPYTEALMSAVPRPDPRVRAQRLVLEGDVPDPAHPPAGCHFHPRCRYAEDRCRVEAPPLREVKPGHQAACHFAGEIPLAGIRQRA